MIVLPSGQHAELQLPDVTIWRSWYWFGGTTTYRTDQLQVGYKLFRRDDDDLSLFWLGLMLAPTHLQPGKPKKKLADELERAVLAAARLHLQDHGWTKDEEASQMGMRAYHAPLTVWSQALATIQNGGWS